MFVRYIDDYECYCETREEAEDFILKLEQELRNYLLSLNPKKVIVEELPLAYQDQWVIVLRNNIPPQRQPSPRDIMSFLDLAVDLQKHHPEGSVLKYATRTLANSKKFDENSADFFLKYLIALAVHRPNVLPILCQVAKENDAGLFSFPISHWMSLTASLGFEARNRMVSEIFVCPAKRKTDMAVLRNAAMTCGILPVLACEASSPRTVSRTQWTLFSMVQCSRRSLSKSSADATSGERLVMPYCV